MRSDSNFSGYFTITRKNISGYATWFAAGGAIRIAHYELIDDVITRKLLEIEKNGDYENNGHLAVNQQFRHLLHFIKTRTLHHTAKSKACKGRSRAVQLSLNILKYLENHLNYLKAL